MFEEARLLGPTERSVVVQTRQGTNIKNLIELEPGPGERATYQRFVAKFGKNWVPRKSPTGIYNCAGHVWASRRTAILEEDQWRLILREDGYRRLGEHEEPAPDDLALYVDVDARGEALLHVARVLGLCRGVAPDSRRIPWVVSKWNSTSGEAMHHVHDVPYGRQEFHFRMEYWTDRPI